MSPGNYKGLILYKSMNLFMQLGHDEWRRGVLARMEGECILGSKEQMSTVVNLYVLVI